MKNLSTLFLLLCSLFFNTPVKAQGVEHFFIGTYTTGESKGIYRAGMYTTSGKLVRPVLMIPSNNPSFIVLSRQQNFLLAVNEVSVNSSGFIESFSVSPKGDQLQRVSKESSGGDHPAYVTINRDNFVLAANYGSGNLGLLTMDDNGILKLRDVKQHYGSGPVKGRQDSPHVHSAFFEPGTDRIFAADLGTDEITVYRLDKEYARLNPATVPTIKLAPGSGPRHLAFHPGLKILYAVNELSNSVTVISLNKDESFTILQDVSSLPKDFSKNNACADIHITRDGKFLYVSNRGLDAIAVFAVNPKDGKLKLIGNESTKGQNPRNFTLSPDDSYLLVANQTSQDIVSFRRNSKTGALTFADQMSVPTPVCLLFEQ